MNYYLKVIKRYKYTILFILQLLIMYFQFNIIGNSLFVILILYLLYDLILQNNRDNIFLYLLIFGSYHSNFPNIYTFKIFNISIVYIFFILFFLTTINNVINKKLNNRLKLILPIILFVPYHILIGLLNKYSTYVYLSETISFLMFYYFFLYAVTNHINKNNEIIETLKKYIILYYPLFVLFSALFNYQDSSKLFYDEFSKFQILSFFPIIYLTYYSLEKKFLLNLLNLISFFVIAITGYLSTLNIILFILSLIILSLKTNLIKSIYIIFFMIIITFIGHKLLLEYGNKITQWKVKQIYLTLSNIGLNDIKSIPRSPRVRILEVMNSYEELSNNSIYLLFGKGYGSYFTDQKFSFKTYKIDITKGDVYSLDQVQQKKYYLGHGFISFSLIKWGLYGILIITLISLLSFFISQKEFIWLSCSFPLYILTTFGYGLKNFILTGFLLGLIFLILFINSKTNNNYESYHN